MDNGTSTLEKLFATHVFRIPEYQQAYAWEREHARSGGGR